MELMKIKLMKKRAKLDAGREIGKLNGKNDYSSKDKYMVICYQLVNAIEAEQAKINSGGELSKDSLQKVIVDICRANKIDTQQMLEALEPAACVEYVIDELIKDSFEVEKKTDENRSEEYKEAIIKTFGVEYPEKWENLREEIIGNFFAIENGELVAKRLSKDEQVKNLTDIFGQGYSVDMKEKMNERHAELLKEVDKNNGV